MVMIANHPVVKRPMWQGARAAFRPPARTPAVFLRHIRMFYEVFCFVQRAGAMELESGVEVPAKSRIFANQPRFSTRPRDAGFRLRFAANAGARRHVGA